MMTSDATPASAMPALHRKTRSKAPCQPRGPLRREGGDDLAESPDLGSEDIDIQIENSSVSAPVAPPG